MVTALRWRKVQVTAINERTRQPSATCAATSTRDHARADHGVAFPVAPLVLVILLQGIEITQRTGRTIRTQAHVHAELKPVGGDRVQGAIERWPGRTKTPWLSAVKRRRRFHPRGRRIRSMSTANSAPPPQLAHAENDHLLRLAAAPPSGVPNCWASAGTANGRLVDAGIGHVGESRRVSRSAWQVVAPDDHPAGACWRRRTRPNSSSVSAQPGPRHQSAHASPRREATVRSPLRASANGIDRVTAL